MTMITCNIKMLFLRLNDEYKDFYVKESTFCEFRQMFISKRQQNSGSHKFISAGVNKLADPINLFPLGSTNWWIPYTYFGK